MWDERFFRKYALLLVKNDNATHLKKYYFLLDILSERRELFAQELEELGDVKLISLEILQLEEEMNSTRGSVLL